MNAGDQFSFELTVEGNFAVDWGDGSAIQNITRAKITMLQTYSHTYASAGDYTVKLYGRASSYNPDTSSTFNIPAITFNSSANKTKMTALSGDLGKMFPIFDASLTGSPRFFRTFMNCTGLTSIPANLFAGLQGAPVNNMFNGTFSYCSGLTSIPAGLFSGIQGPPAQNMFHYTFGNCTGLTSIPAGLFAGIQGAPAVGMFSWTFMNCSGLTSIPADLFGNISGEPVSSMFDSTFDGCKSLTGPSATINGQYLYDLFPTATQTHVSRCYYYLTKLSDYSKIPAAWKWP
jgi:hypothetical protein